MSAKKPSQELVSDEEKRRAINPVSRKLAVRVGVDPELLDTKISFGSTSRLSPEREHELAKAMAFQMGFLQSIEALLPTIRTQEELDRFVEGLEATVEPAPTIVRNTMDKIRSKVPRRGGTGREPKLDYREATMVCREILKLVGKKYTAKEAIAEVSRMCPELLGKAVGTRTLQKAWDKRDEFLRE
jgi:hypothetical protein